MSAKYHDPRHARLFELIRQHNRALSIAERIESAPDVPQAALIDVARRAAASWQKIC